MVPRGEILTLRACFSDLKYVSRSTRPRKLGETSPAAPLVCMMLVLPIGLNPYVDKRVVNIRQGRDGILLAVQIAGGRPDNALCLGQNGVLILVFVERQGEAHHQPVYNNFLKVGRKIRLDRRKGSEDTRRGLVRVELLAADFIIVRIVFEGPDTHDAGRYLKGVGVAV